MQNISQQSWFSIPIDSSQLTDINILYAKFYNHTIGIEQYETKSIFYFDTKKKSLIKDLISNHFSQYQFNLEDIKYQDWHTSYEKHFKPIKINQDLIIIPPWYKINNTQNIDYIKIMPGMAFGTGNHDTTQLIITSLIDYINLNDRVLDLGSGSGILSIAALKFGASNVTAVEYDEDCKDNFYENMKLNKITQNYSLSIQDVLSYKDYDYDLIVANINKNVILDLLPNIAKLRKNKSIIILSGLLAADRDDILNLVNKLNFNILAEQKQGEWICFIID